MVYNMHTMHNYQYKNAKQVQNWNIVSFVGMFSVFMPTFCCVFFQGDQGLPGEQGTPGDRGIGEPGPKVKLLLS